MDCRKIPVMVSAGFWVMVLFVSTACSAFKELSLFKSKNSSKQKVTNQSSGFTSLIDYSERFQTDSSAFDAWLLVDGGFSFHPDSGIRGDKALIQYLGKRHSILHLKDSLISQQDSSRFLEYIASQNSLLKTKDKKTSTFSWMALVAGMLVVAWILIRRYKIHSVI